MVAVWQHLEGQVLPIAKCLPQLGNFQILEFLGIMGGLNFFLDNIMNTPVNMEPLFQKTYTFIARKISKVTALTETLYVLINVLEFREYMNFRKD